MIIIRANSNDEITPMLWKQELENSGISPLVSCGVCDDCKTTIANYSSTFYSSLTVFDLLFSSLI